MKSPQLTSHSTFKKLKAFPLTSETRQGFPLVSLLFDIVIEVLTRATGKKKK